MGLKIKVFKKLTIPKFQSHRFPDFDLFLWGFLRDSCLKLVDFGSFSDSFFSFLRDCVSLFSSDSSFGFKFNLLDLLFLAQNGISGYFWILRFSMSISWGICLIIIFIQCIQK